MRSQSARGLISGRSREAGDVGLEVGHDRKRLGEGEMPAGERAILGDVNRRDNGTSADLADSHERAFQVARVAKAVEEERVVGLACGFDGAGGAGVLVAVLVQRRLAGSVERQRAGAHFHDGVLGAQAVDGGKRGAGKLFGAVGHAAMRQAGRRDAGGFGDKAVRAGREVQAQGVAHDLGLHERDVFDVSGVREALAGEHGGDGAGQDEHIAVESQLDIGHERFLSTGFIIPHARRRAASDADRAGLYRRKTWNIPRC